MRILHASDLHLDSPFDGLPPERAAQRRAEQRELLERLAELARSSAAQAVLLAGDLLDSERIYAETAQQLARCLGSIGAPVFIAPGNHDPYAPGSPYASVAWPDNVHIFRSGQIEAVELPGQDAVVYGAAFTGAHREDPPLAGFSAPRDGRLHLMVLHGDAAGRPDSRYGPIAPADIAASGLDYLALGHVHAFSGVQRAGEVPWAYPGCPEGRGFDETGPKGVLCGSVEPGGRARLEFVPLCARQYRVTQLSVTGLDGPDAVAQAILAHAAPEDLVRFVLTGESEGVDPGELERRCAGGFYSLSVRDRTQVRRDLWRRQAEEDLTGLFLRHMRARLDAAESEEEAEILQLATRFGLAALEGREDCGA